VEKPACRAATFSVIKSAAADTSGDGEDGATLARILQTFLGVDYPPQSLKSFQMACVNLDQNFEMIPENLKEDVKTIVWVSMEALAQNLIKLKEEADEADQPNGKGKAGLKKAAGDFPSLGRESFLQNFCFGSRIEKWKADEAIEKTAAAADSDPEGEPEPVRKPTRKSLALAGDEDDEDETEARPRSFSIPICGFGPLSLAIGQPKVKVKKSLIEQDIEDGVDLWPSLNGGRS
jgi:hypothetical protein